MANAQLHLIHFDDDHWKLDARTIRVGRKGLASARAALARAHREAHQEARREESADGSKHAAA